MEIQLVKIETAKLAKKKGFCEVCQNDCRYNKDGLQTEHPFIQKLHNEKEFNIPAPTQALLQKWLRETHFIYIDIRPFYFKNERFDGWELYQAYKLKEGIRSESGYALTFDSFEDALEQGLQEALELLYNK